MPVATDFEAEGLLDGVGDERARRARLELLRTLEQEGFSLDECAGRRRFKGVSGQVDVYRVRSGPR